MYMYIYIHDILYAICYIKILYYIFCILIYYTIL